MTTGIAKATDGLLLGAAVCLTLLLMMLTPAAAQKRLALVVGNGAYTHVPTLTNPANDAADIVNSLQPLGFQVFSGVDLDRRRFAALLKQFADAIAPGDETFFFYAGHGLQARGVNYLVPVDAQIRAESDLAEETLRLDQALSNMQRAGTKIVMLDACRNNPFAGNLGQSSGTRAIDANLGLAISTASELGTFIAYATQPGNVALDGDGRNSPFTQTLKANLTTRGQSITDLMMVVRNEVATATNGAQIPWEHSALARKFYFNPGTEVALGAGGQKASEAAEAWSWIKNSRNPTIVEEFIRRFPNTPFTAQARTTLAALKGNPQVVATAIPNLKTMSLRQVQPSFNCREHYLDAEVAICNNAELSILDNELSRLYETALRGRDQRQRQDLAIAQQRWIEGRNDCKTDTDCLIKAYQLRVVALARTARTTPPPPAKAQPSFECSTHVLPAEVAICADSKLARLDVDLNKRYGTLAGTLNAERRRALGVEQRQWLVARDTCASDRSCLELQYQARIGQISTWR